MSERLREQQYALARHLRDPAAHAPPPGLEQRRLRVYRELFFNNIRGLLGNGFPVIAQTLGEVGWTALVQAFYAEHRAQTPLFARIAAEFVAYVEGRGGDGRPPWLPELAHYEWVEQALYVSDAQPPAHDPQGDLLNGMPVLSPLALPLAYRWPVAEIGPDRIPDTAPVEPTLLLVHRGIDHQVRFARIAPLVYRLLVGMQSASQTGRQHLAALAAETGDEPAQFIQLGLPLLQQLHAQGVVLGTHIPTEQNHAV